MRRPVHPGEVLREEFLRPLSLSAYTLAMALTVPETLIDDSVKERLGITADTALSAWLVTLAAWLVMQAEFDLKTLRGEVK
jgi:antitoxin HigA-1